MASRHRPRSKPSAPGGAGQSVFDFADGLGLDSQAFAVRYRRTGSPDIHAEVVAAVDADSAANMAKALLPGITVLGVERVCPPPASCPAPGARFIDGRFQAGDGTDE